ncbi:YihY/virulence factor BrkB family protein [Thioclava litoralis]|uniref:YihY/virulence factor BrkB family protein n=1 Tax=Thioclava litoralis TaxID=3076557 RepID=A0ABZ1E0W9_9RHOB|nr:YihY/virulence factor BrkB family protein [Thioclava sp. FTW29]
MSDRSKPQPGRRASDPPEDAAAYGDPADRNWGRQAAGPFHMGLKAWWCVLLRTKGQITEDRVMAVAAGVTFYSILALFPALTALVSIFGFFADRGEVLSMLDEVSRFVPPEALTLIRGQLEALIGADQSALGWTSIISIALALWTANGGMKALIEALNVAYNERENRNFFWMNIVGLGMTLGAIVFLCVLILAAAVLPVALAFLPQIPGWGFVVLVARWPLMAGVLVLALSMLYRIAPNRRAPRLVWVLPGALAGSVLLLLSSWGFSFYTSNFGNYSATYGSIGAVVVLMMWIWIATIAVMLGAELNSEAERQTARDSTVGPRQPLGQREADVADSVADISS